MELGIEDDGKHLLPGVEQHCNPAERSAQGDGEYLVEEIAFAVFL
jgi:hypothetical protein